MESVQGCGEMGCELFTPAALQSSQDLAVNSATGLGWGEHLIVLRASPVCLCYCLPLEYLHPDWNCLHPTACKVLHQSWVPAPEI